MRVIALVENTSISKDYKSKHGLCLYIETKKHKLLFDLGSNSLFLGNAVKLDVDISDIDSVIISHGHNDHGGALKYFLEGNYIPVCTGTKLPLFLISFFIKFFCTPIWIEELRYNCLLLQQT